MTENEHTLGYADVATLVGVSVETVRRWRQRGLPCVKPGARVRFSAREVLAWQNQQRPGPHGVAARGAEAGREGVLDEQVEPRRNRHAPKREPLLRRLAREHHRRHHLPRDGRLPPERRLEAARQERRHERGRPHRAVEEEQREHREHREARPLRAERAHHEREPRHEHSPAAGGHDAHVAVHRRQPGSRVEAPAGPQLPGFAAHLQQEPDELREERRGDERQRHREHHPHRLRDFAHLEEERRHEAEHERQQEHPAEVPGDADEVPNHASGTFSSTDCT